MPYRDTLTDSSPPSIAFDSAMCENDRLGAGCCQRINVSEHAFSLWTDCFEVTTPSAAFINPRCFGKDFALWMADRLQRHELSLARPIQEDWGWALLVSFERHRFTISIGVMDESIGQVPAEWRVGVEYERFLNGLRAWFRPVPHAALAALAQILEDIIQGEPKFHKITREYTA